MRRVAEDIEALRDAAEILGYRESGNSSLKDLAPVIAPLILQLLVGQQGMKNAGQPTMRLTGPSQISAAQAVPIIEAPKPEPQVTEIHVVLMPDGSLREMSSAEFAVWKQEPEAARHALQAAESPPTESVGQQPHAEGPDSTQIRP